MKWEVFTNLIGDKKVYHVGRKLRENEPLHSGNVEYAGELTDDKDAAEALAKDLNSGMKKTMTAQDVERLRTYITGSIETNVSMREQDKRDGNLVSVAYWEGAITATKLILNFLEELMKE